MFSHGPKKFISFSGNFIYGAKKFISFSGNFVYGAKKSFLSQETSFMVQKNHR